MADKIRFRQVLRLYALYTRMDLDLLLRDTRIALLAMAADTLSSVASISGVFLLAWRFDGVGGMTRWEVLFMLGYVTCVSGLFRLFFSANNGHLSRRFGRGQFDHMIVQPIPYAAQLITEGFDPFTGSQTLLCGAGIVIWALSGMGRSPSLPWALCLAGSLCVSLAIVIGLSYAFSALAFWKPVAFEEIATTVVDDLTGVLPNYPLSGMPPGFQLALVTVAPLGLLGWFPACALLGKPPLGLSAIYPLAVAVLIWIIAGLALRKGFRHYGKTGSNRYTAGGHRR